MKYDGCEGQGSFDLCVKGTFCVECMHCAFWGSRWNCGHANVSQKAINRPAHSVLILCFHKRWKQVSFWARGCPRLNIFLIYLPQALSVWQAYTSSSWELSQGVPMLIVVPLSLYTQFCLELTWFWRCHPYYPPSRWGPLYTVVLCNTILNASSIHLSGYIHNLVKNSVRCVMPAGPCPYKLPSIQIWQGRLGF